MMTTKRRFGKLGGNVAYHGYQSFNTGEVTPEEAHKIGMETAKRMWGKDFEVVITTHLNTENLHNHFVVNSVSFRTGRKFENHISDHIRLREISDDVCREYDKTVLEDAPFYKSQKKEYWLHKSGQLTHRDILRQDVDFAISKSANLMEFSNIMLNLGYTFNRSIMNAHPSVIAGDWKRPIRIDSLGADYTKERLMQRMADNRYPVHSFGGNPRTKRPKQTPLMELEYQMRRIKYMNTVEAIFYLLLELLKPMKQQTNTNYPHSPLLRQELVKFERYKKQFRLLHDNEITTVQELDIFIAKTKDKISELEQARSKLDNHIRRAQNDDKENLKAERREMSARIKSLREQLKIAEYIKLDIPKVQAALDSERKIENKILQKERGKLR